MFSIRGSHSSAQRLALYWSWHSLRTFCFTSMEWWLSFEVFLSDLFKNCGDCNDPIELGALISYSDFLANNGWDLESSSFNSYVLIKLINSSFLLNETYLLTSLYFVSILTSVAKSLLTKSYVGIIFENSGVTSPSIFFFSCSQISLTSSNFSVLYFYFLILSEKTLFDSIYWVFFLDFTLFERISSLSICLRCLWLPSA